MEREEKNERAYRSTETEVFLQWGNRKRLRCVRVRGPEPSSTSRIRRKVSSPFLTFSQPPTRLSRESEAAGLRSSGSPEKEERCYATRGSPEKENGKVPVVSVAVAGNQSGGENNRGGRLVCPKLYIALSSKEKEEDFMAMKGCKLPQRPKKRAKVIQRTLLLVSPGAWLTDMSIERYEVREKKNTKKRPRGLKAMGGMESDSE